MSKATMTSAWALSCCLLAGCLVDPFNGQQIKARSQPISVGGLVPYGDEPIAFKAQNVAASSWLTLATVRSGTMIRVVDAAGVPWTTWDGKVTLPTSRDFWTSRGSGSDRFVDINIKAVGVSSGELTTFSDTDADCIAGMHFSGYGGLDIAASCGDGPRMRVRVPCGDKGEACCTSRQHNNSCNSGLTCKSQLCTLPAVDVVMKEEHGTDGGVPVTPDPTDATCTQMHGLPCPISTSICASGDAVSGKWKCANNRLTCDAVYGVDYCNIGNAGGSCGAGLTDNCGDHLDCTPGLRCHAQDKTCYRPTTGLCREPSGWCWKPKSSGMGGIPRTDFCP
jgi:hypothetical protein